MSHAVAILATVSRRLEKGSTVNVQEPPRLNQGAARRNSAISIAFAWFGLWSSLLGCIAAQLYGYWSEIHPSPGWYMVMGGLLGLVGVFALILGRSWAARYNESIQEVAEVGATVGMQGALKDVEAELMQRLQSFQHAQSGN